MMARRLVLAAGTALALLGSAATAQTARAPAPAGWQDDRLVQAAGWKALFLCSGSFVAGLDEAVIADTDLQGGYPELQPLIGGLPARIDRKGKRVEVDPGDGRPTRVARFVQGRGCVQLPAVADPDAVALPPEIIGGPELKRIDARPWPMGDRAATASLPRARRAALDRLVADALAGERYGKGSRTSAVLVVHNGRIVAERYALGIGMHVPQRTWSVAKSLTSALVGRATQLNVLDPGRPAHVPEWDRPDDPRAAITVDQLLRMQSGLDTAGPGNRTDALYFGGATVAGTAARAPVEVPAGTRFRYANNDTLLASRAVMADLGEAGETFAYTQFLWPLGMTRTTIETDWMGAPILSSQVWMTARDLARLALLHLNDGRWNGQRLLPEGWVSEATTARGPQPQDPRQQGYGRAIWLLGKAQGLPDGSYAFFGNRGQYAVVVPAAGLIVVRRGFDPAGAGFDPAAFTRDVLAALG